MKTRANRPAGRLLREILAGGMVTLAACATSSARPERAGAAAAEGGRSAACTPSPDENRRIVLDLYRLALTERDPRAAFERYAAPGFVEHKADVPEGTREATAAYLEHLIAEFPQPEWTVVRSIAEGDLVFLHVRFTPAPDAAPYAIGDIFRVRNCRIVEHWDVVAPPQDRQVNPNSRF